MESELLAVEVFGENGLNFRDTDTTTHELNDFDVFDSFIRAGEDDVDGRHDLFEEMRGEFFEFDS